MEWMSKWNYLLPRPDHWSLIPESYGGGRQLTLRSCPLLLWHTCASIHTTPLHGSTEINMINSKNAVGLAGYPNDAEKRYFWTLAFIFRRKVPEKEWSTFQNDIFSWVKNNRKWNSRKKQIIAQMEHQTKENGNQAHTWLELWTGSIIENLPT